MSSNQTITTDSSKPAVPTKAGWILLVIAWIFFIIPIPGFGWIGWAINLAAFIVAIVVIVRGATAKGVIQLVLSVVVSPIIYFIGLAIFAAAVVAGTNKSTVPPVHHGSQVPVESAHATAARAVTIAKLFSDYESNEVAADQKYKGQVLTVSGTVQSIDKDPLNNIVVALKTNNPFVPAHAYMDDEHESLAASLQKGQSIQFVCKGDGMIMGAPMLKECSPAH